MIKRFALTLCLFTSTVWASGLIPAAIAQPVTPAFTQEQAASNITTTLSLEDLPPGFRELPNNVKTQLQPRLEAFAQQLAQAGMKPDKYFVFINPQTFQMVFGFTGVLPNQPEQAKFDASLKQIQEPEVQQELISQYRELLKQAQGIEILDYSIIPDMNSIAEASTGISLSLAMQGQPLRVDVAAFRRNNVGAFTAIMYPKDQVPTVQLSAIARKLDSKIQATGAITPTAAPNTNVNPNGMANPAPNPSSIRDAGMGSPNTESSGSNHPTTTEMK